MGVGLTQGVVGTDERGDVGMGHLIEGIKGAVERVVQLVPHFMCLTFFREEAGQTWFQYLTDAVKALLERERVPPLGGVQCSTPVLQLIYPLGGEGGPRIKEGKEGHEKMKE